MSTFRFWMGWPNTTPTPYGNRTRSVLPSAIKTVAINSNSWAAGPQLVAFLASVYPKYVECSFTYVKNISGMTEGWYFWRGYLDGSTKIWEKYEPVTFNPEGHDITLSLFNSNGTWFAAYQDHTQGVLNSYQIQQAPNTTLYLGTTGQRHRMGIETPSSTCSQYPTFSMQFTKYKYLNSAGSETTQNPTSVADENSLPTCITTNRTTLTISK